MAYTYDDFVKKANEAGMINQFSSYDLDLARQYPEFGLSMLGLKQSYAGAGSEQERMLINEQANQLRSSYGNYTGGRDGSLYISNGRSPGSYRSGYEDAMDRALADLNGYGGFDFQIERPAYESRYQQQMDVLLGEITNRSPFEYNQDTDPVWSAYKKQYRREGQRAAADTMAQAAAMTGGVPSSYAATAAQQQGDYYAAQLSDMLPQLSENAYNRYLNEYQMKQQDLSAVQGMEQQDYQKYLDALGQWNADRNLAYNQWQDMYNMRLNALNALSDRDSTLYGRALDELNWQQSQGQAADEAQSRAREIVDSMLAAGGRPSAELIAQSGYPQEYVDALAAYYARQAAGSGGGYSGGGGRYSGGGDSGDAYASLFAAMRDSGMDPLDYLLANGYDSNGLINTILPRYEAWLSRNPGSAAETPVQKPWNERQYQMFLDELAVMKDKEAILNMLEDASRNGKITEEQVRQLAKQYGIRL